MLRKLEFEELSNIKVNQSVFYKIKGKTVKAKVISLNAVHAYGPAIETFSKKHGVRYLNDCSIRFFYVKKRKLNQDSTSLCR